MNCPQHIRPRYTEEEIAPVTEKLRQRIAELEEALGQSPGRRSTVVE